MHEPSLPGAADRLSPEDPSGLRRRLAAILSASPAPTVCVPRPAEAGGDLMVAGEALFDLARRRLQALQRSGMHQADLLASDSDGIGRVVDVLACILGGFVYWPFTDASRIVDGQLVTDSGASLVWRPNPMVSSVQTSQRQHEPPAAIPLRITTRLRDAMQPAGTQVRVLIDSLGDAPPVAFNAQTIARLGSTLRRQLGLQRQSVRYCAAPATSAAGVLLDLLPGIAARQVMVVPEEASPSALTVARAIKRYHPDSLTLTLHQTIALLGVPMDDITRTALRHSRVLIADTHPVPRAVREALAERTAKVSVAYVLPEAGDAFVI